MKKVFVLVFLILGFFSLTMGQGVNPVRIDPTDPGFREKFSHLNFNGKFYVLALKDEVNNYYMADFSQFPEKFERIYFLSLVYNSDKIVNIDSDISQDRVWFQVNGKFSDKEAGAQFNEFRKNTLKASSTFTAAEKAAWMKKNDKFK